MEVIPEQWTSSFPAKNGRFKRGRGGWRKKDVECQVHTWMMKKEKKLWYIRRGKIKGRGTEKRRKKKESQIFRVCPKKIYCYKLFSYLGSFLHLNPIFWPRIRLAFFPALYKFIVWATWAWIHSRFGRPSNLVLTYIIKKHTHKYMKFYNCLLLLSVGIFFIDLFQIYLDLNGSFFFFLSLRSTNFYIYYWTYYFFSWIKDQIGLLLTFFWRSRYY